MFSRAALSLRCILLRYGVNAAVGYMHYTVAAMGQIDFRPLQRGFSYILFTTNSSGDRDCENGR